MNNRDEYLEKLKVQLDQWERQTSLWETAAPSDRSRVLSELIWRTNCILEGSQTSVMGLNRFELGLGFKLVHTRLGAEPVLIVVV